jgi:hypothetical protein
VVINHARWDSLLGFAVREVVPDFVELEVAVPA